VCTAASTSSQLIEELELAFKIAPPTTTETDTEEENLLPGLQLAAIPNMLELELRKSVSQAVNPGNSHLDHNGREFSQVKCVSTCRISGPCFHRVDFTDHPFLTLTSVG